ncbi:endoplasmic reticulum membrane-associated RNA degradation protein [Rhizophagus irregularis DAOM 181602=DAOM 197198]|nr:endoplasmic reticulum membrane-associated RNA degradation protein [Rhizophagus irregularis DAOM 181602=DAOM 197198]
MSFSNCFIRSFWLGKTLQTEELSNIITRKEEIRTALNKWQSCLNLRVRQLLENNSLNKYSLDCNIPIEKGLLKENAFIGVRNINVPYDTLEAEPFTAASSKIKILAYQISQFFDSNITSTNDFFKLYNDELGWCGNSDIFRRCVELYLEKDYLSVMLIVISNLERLLGDIIYSLHDDTSIIPLLIRDLLIAPSLVLLLGEEMIFFLRCIIGPPNSMNLRNVLWHGFISPHEFLKVPVKWYCALILIITMSICNIVRHKGVIGLLKKRNNVNFKRFYYLTDNADDRNAYISTEKNFDELYECVMYGHASPPQYPHHMILEFLLFKNFFVIPRTYPTWLCSFRYLSNNQVLLFFVLALPLLEHCLRRIYVCVNKDVQEHRMCTVETGEYFLTLDIILGEKVAWAFCGIKEEKQEEEQINEIYSELGGGIMDLLLDLFVHVDGPRLRDRVAHGEANHLIVSPELFNLSSPLYNYFIGLLIVLWNKYETKISLIYEDEDIINKDYSFIQTIDIESYEKWISNYRSRFHPISMLWKESVQVITNVWKCWNVCQEMVKTGRFIMGNWVEFPWITIDVQECCSRLYKCKLGKAKNNKKAIYWNEINYTKDDAKVINFRRGVIKKANAGVEKLHSILTTLQSSTSLSSRKRKNTQTLFNLFPSIFQQLYYALLTLEQTRDQKLMLAILIFIERWNGFCVEGNWKNINKAFEEFIKIR